MTSPNHMNKVASSIATPVKNVHRPHAASLSQLATPIIITNIAIDPTKGHLLWLGTKYALALGLWSAMALLPCRDACG